MTDGRLVDHRFPDGKIMAGGMVAGHERNSVELFVGSTNPSKIRQLTAALLTAGVRAVPLDISFLPPVPEDTGDVVGNAQAKAKAFAAAIGNNCLAMDAGLTFPNLGRELQPGPNVRRLPGACAMPNDNEVLAYYTDLCDRHGGRVRARWTYGFAIGAPDGRDFHACTTVERMMVTPPSSRRHPGYPLDSLLQDPSTGRFLAEFTGVEEARMWQATIGKALQDFVTAAVGTLGSPGDVTGEAPARPTGQDVR
jgi:inosine/xanthosine triphosphate pyrophosphatase family protein